MAIYKVENGVAIAYADVALSGGGTPTPSEQTLSSIAVTTPPTKTVYDVGDMLDLSGMVVTATYSDGTTADVSRSVITNPIDGALLAFGTNQVSIRYTESGITKTTTQAIKVGKELSSISVTTPPTKVTYDAGDILDLTGMVVTAVYDDQTTANVTSSVTTTPANHAALQGGTSSVEISYTENGITKTTTQAITVTGTDRIYGVLWDGGQSHAFTRTDDAAQFAEPQAAISGGSGSSPFDSILPWSGMNIVEDNDAGTMVSIPKFYYKWTRVNKSMKLQISNGSFDGAHVSPAHADRGDGNGERSVVYVARYLSGENSYKSITGVTKDNHNSVTHADMRTAIALLGSGIYSMDYAMFWTIAMLYLVEYADWDCQGKIGRGGTNGIETTGETDSMLYHTGTMHSSRNGWHHIQYRHIEDFWAFGNTFVEGIKFDGTDIYAIRNPADFGNINNGVLVGQREVVSGSNSMLITGYTDPSAISGYEYALYPNSVIEESGNTYYITDSARNRSTDVDLRFGYNSSSLYTGMFAISTTDLSSGATRLMKLP